MILLDTDVMIDILRDFEPAKEWLASMGAQEIGLPGLVVMELIQGCRNTREQKQIEKSLRAFPIFWVEPQQCERALEYFAAYHLSHQLGLLDALIAETAIGQDAELATFNKKHYRVVEDLKIIQPYKR